jgi:hypothetical protein
VTADFIVPTFTKNVKVGRVPQVSLVLRDLGGPLRSSLVTDRHSSLGLFAVCSVLVEASWRRLPGLAKTARPGAP